MANSNGSIAKMAREIGPRIISMADLRKKLGPLMAGVPWAEDALQDLWRMGAPDPDPRHHPCDRKHYGCFRQKVMGMPGCDKHACHRERRVLLPTQFTEWWKQVSERQGIEYTPEQILRITGYSHLRDPRKLDRN